MTGTSPVSPDHASELTVRASQKAKLGREHEARADLMAAIRIAEEVGSAPEAAMAHYALGRLDALAGQRIGGLEHLKAAAGYFGDAGLGHLQVIALRAVDATEARQVSSEFLPELCP